MCVCVCSRLGEQYNSESDVRRKAMRSGSTDRVSQARKEKTAIPECFDQFHCCLVEKIHLDGAKLGGPPPPPAPHTCITLVQDLES